jgi:hypothetical protein
VLIAYSVAVSLYLIGGPQWIDQHVPRGWTESQQIKFVIFSLSCSSTPPAISCQILAVSYGRGFDWKLAVENRFQPKIRIEMIGSAPIAIEKR